VNQMSIMRPSFQNIMSPVFNRSDHFDVLELFASGSQGAWLDVFDINSLFQDAAGTTQVTAAGNPVGQILDKSQGLALGPDLITNGTFDTGTTGWTSHNSAVLSVVSGTLRVTNGATGRGGAYQTFSTEIGKRYKVSYDSILGTSPDGGFIYAGVSAGNASLGGAFNTVKINGSLYFTATGTTTYITLLPSTTANGFYNDFDNISIRKISGNHATQSTAGSRPTFTSDSAVENVSSDSINWSAPVGLYTIAYLGSAGSVILDAQALSGATNIMLAVKIYEYIAVNRSLGSVERRRLQEYLDNK